MFPTLHLFQNLTQLSHLFRNSLSSGVEFRIIRSSLQFPNAGTSTAISCGGGSLIIEDSQITQMEAAVSN